MIELIPAIDLIDGKCVRLTKGDYNQQTVYGNDPVGMAVKFEKMGFKRLHVVDLDGAKSNHVVNIDILKGITSSTRLEVDFGGGIKSEKDIAIAFAAGSAMVTVGSIAATDKELSRTWLEKYGADRIILGADVKNGKVSVHGWKDDSGMELMPFLNDHISHGVKMVMCTDISKDGTLQGPSIGLYKEIMAKFPGIRLIASGGVSSNEDIHQLENAGVSAVVIGKAFYEGKIDIKEIIHE